MTKTDQTFGYLDLNLAAGIGYEKSGLLAHRTAALLGQPPIGTGNGPRTFSESELVVVYLIRHEPSAFRRWALGELPHEIEIAYDDDMIVVLPMAHGEQYGPWITVTTAGPLATAGYLSGLGSPIATVIAVGPAREATRKAIGR